MAKTIYTYLFNDDPNGSRSVSMDDCMCMLYNIKREDTFLIKEQNTKLQKPALYILLNKECHKAYIGETDNFAKRIVQHISKKDFWDEVLAFLGSTENSIGKTEVEYLELLAYNTALNVKSYDLSDNTQSPKKPYMSIMQKSKTDKFFEYVRFFAQFVGCDIFKPRLNVIIQTPTEDTNAKILPIPIEFTSENLKGKTKLSFNGEGKYCKRDMVLRIVKEFVRQYPDTTYAELRATFKRDYLGRFAQYEFLQDDIVTASKWKELGEDHSHYFLDDENILTSGDGVRFAVCVEWDKNNIISVLGIAKALGWTFNIVK
ncbi:MAG: GIY-YIG nuclease family protein [Bacteroidales bacterium]|nr:GIY-YIG nuclease family protein [Bacteroidales bacterium]MBR7035507.1 GIY-YIG nuclease family protein [Bacteroidales bacterium]